MAGQETPAVGESLSISELFEQLETRTLRIGDLVNGTVSATDGQEATIQCDGFEGFVELTEGESAIEIGGEHAFFVESVAPRIVLSLHKGQRLALWNQLQALQSSGAEVTVTVTAETRGELSVDLMGLRAILPYRELQPGRSREFKALANEKIGVQILHIRERKNQIIVSERALHQGNPAERKAATIAALEVGQVLEGEVMRLTHFGAFLDIGGLDGLLHIKDMSWRRLKEPSEAVRIGDFLTVKVLEFNRDSEKVSLGLKQMSPDPWLDALERYAPGAEVRGHVVGLTDFGAFVMMPDGIEGLVHLSEMSWTEEVEHPSKVLKKGQEISAWVVRCESDRRRLGLSIRNPADSPWLGLRDRLPVGTKLSTKVARVADFGIFVELGDGLDGLVHSSDFSWGSVDQHPSKLFEPGQEVEVMVLDIDAERGRASLGIKHLNEDLASELMRKYQIGDRREATVSSIQSEGIFVELEPGLEGLMVSHNDLEIGQSITIQVREVDFDNKRVLLDLAEHESASKDESEAVEPAPEVDAAEASEAVAEEPENPEGDVIEASVVAADAPAAEASAALEPDAEKIADESEDEAAETVEASQEVTVETVEEPAEKTDEAGDGPEQTAEEASAASEDATEKASAHGEKGDGSESADLGSESDKALDGNPEKDGSGDA